MPNYLLAFSIAFLLSIGFTYLVRSIAIKYKIIDLPTKGRKIHFKSIPLLGGLAIYLSFSLMILYYAFYTNQLIDGYLMLKHVIGILIAGAVLMVGGIFDDKYDLPPKTQILFPVLAVLIVIASGIGIESITNPLQGGTIHFNQLKFELIEYKGVPYFISVMADLFTFVWLMGMMYTTKYLDGLDGLACGVSLIAAVIIFFVAQDLTLQQDYIALLSIILAGSLAGFLLFNFNPASIFLGESGSLFTGFIIGVLAILSGSKIATALLVFGVPIFDVVWVIVRRFFTKQKLTIGDKKHLHHRLLSVGLSHRSSVLFVYFITFIFGVTALFLQTIYKLYVLGFLIFFMVCFAFILVYLFNRKIHDMEKDN